MTEFIDWFGPFLAAAVFLAMGMLKLIGLRWGMVGGRGTSLVHHACGACPAWRSRVARAAVPVVLLGVGFVNLALAVFAWRG